MGRKKKNISLIPDYEWPFEISIRLNRNRPKIAFLSGLPREYYPEDPGHSKFGLTFCLPIPDDTAKPNFVPSSNLLDKPISLLGYGIGGLLGPRFAPLPNEDNPPPNIYQSELIPPRVKKSEKPKRTKWNEFVEQYEDLVEKQYAKYEADQHEFGAGGSMATVTNWSKRPREIKHATSSKSFSQTHHHQHIMTSRSRLGLNKKRDRARRCPKKFSAFGMGLKNSRFPKEELDDKVGVGTYEVGTPALKKSFQITTPEGKLNPRVRIVCHPSGSDSCMTCNKQMYYSDYYQTINKYKVENHKDPETEGNFKMRHLSLCRVCYCKALKDGCHLWRPDDITKVFMKARHCNSVHDHQEGHPQFLMKTTCKATLGLARRELIYSRYFKDDPCGKGKMR